MSGVYIFDCLLWVRNMIICPPKKGVKGKNVKRERRVWEGDIDVETNIHPSVVIILTVRG